MVATPLPIKLVIARASDINLSTPKSKARPSTGITFIAVKVDAKTIKPLPVTPAAPFDVTIRIPMIVKICRKSKSTLNTWAKKMIAIER